MTARGLPSGAARASLRATAERRALVTLPLPDLSLAAMLRRVGVLMRDSPGAALDAEGTVWALNAGAAAAPVYWCCNAVHEFADLGKEIGPGRPLAGMRSLNQVVTLTRATTQVLDDLADHYAAALIARFGRRPCIVGGNCQSAPIAWRVAVRLIAAGVPVTRLVTLDAQVPLPFPGLVRMIFGAGSLGFNPLLRPPADPARPLPWHWERAWAAFDCRIVEGRHGQYFRPEYLPGVAEAVLRPQDPPAARATLDRTFAWRVTATTGTGFWVEAEGPDVAPGEAAVVPVWRGAGGGLILTRGPDWVVPVQLAGPAGARVWRCHLARPDGAPGAAVTPVPCLRGQGPLSWPPAALPAFRTD